MIRKIFSSLILLMAGLFAVSGVFAEDITVSNNGAGSSNNVQINNTSSSTVEQTNNAEIDNNVETNANTGENSTSSNNGDANITTGNIESTSSITNENINTNFAQDPCGQCESQTSVDIKNNGSDSTNSINLDILNDVDVTQSNSAVIVNNAYNNANTGENQANNNNGDVAIDTGNITLATIIKNKKINFGFAEYGFPQNSTNISILNNADGSINSVNFSLDNNLNYDNNNFAYIYNNAVNNANTGRNTADGNNGAVLIVTGDIVSVIEIGNEDINGSFAKLCCEKEIVPPPGGGPGPGPGGPPGPSVQPPGAPSPSGGGDGKVSEGAGQVLGAAIGGVLPVTGNYWLLLMTLLCLTMLLAGWYLRFGSDPSPPLYATI